MTRTHYRDISIKECVEIPTPVVMSQLFAELHRGITTFGIGRIAVSFPDIDQTLGVRLRLHGSQVDLTEFGDAWLGMTARMVRVGGVFSAPPEAGLIVFRRRQPKAGGEAWLRRWQKRHQEAPTQVPEPQRLSEPFVHLHSGSTGHNMVLFIAKADPTTAAEYPNSYGLGAATPAF